MASNISAGKTILDGQFSFKTKDVVVCKYCRGEFKYHRSNSSLNYHLRTKHAFTTRAARSVVEKEKETGKRELRQVSLMQVSGLAKPISQEKYDSITNAIAQWIALNGRPVNIVTDEGLENVMRIACGNHSYTLPSRQVISARIDDLYDLKKREVNNMMSESAYVALTADYWSSMANDSYLGVTGHLIDNNWMFKSFAMCVVNIEERHYAESCAEHFASVARSWGIYDKITTFGTDNARNVVAAVGMLPFQHMPCIAHSLQLSVNKAIADSGIEVVLTKCRKIVGHFRHSPANSAELKTQQRRLSQREEALIQDVPTRWNSTLQMIERLLNSKEALLATLTEPQHKHSFTCMTEAEWEKLRILSKSLESCRYATELLGGEKYITCSVILPTLYHVFHEMTTSDNDPSYLVRFKDSFTTDLESREKNLNLPWLNIATALDPRFKHLRCMAKEKRNEVWMLLQKLIQDSITSSKADVVPPEPPRKRPRLHEMSSDSEDEPLLHHVSDAKVILQRYQNESHIDSDMCPLVWWKLHAGNHPILASLAKKYLSSPATTVPCERLFSLSGNILTKKRNSLDPSNVNKLVCLNNWLHVKE